jgi:Family of unknown function (DUF6491)
VAHRAGSARRDTGLDQKNSGTKALDTKTLGEKGRAMIKKVLIAGVLAGLMTSAVVARQTKERALGVEARIPFVNHGGVNNFHADGDKGLWVQDQYRRWYYAALIGACTELPFATEIGFVTRGTDALDKFGEIVVRNQRCSIVSFVTSVAPPKKAKKMKSLL